MDGQREVVQVGIYVSATANACFGTMKGEGKDRTGMKGLYLLKSTSKFEVGVPIIYAK